MGTATDETGTDGRTPPTAPRDGFPTRPDRRAALLASLSATLAACGGGADDGGAPGDASSIDATGVGAPGTSGPAASSTGNAPASRPPSPEPGLGAVDPDYPPPGESEAARFLMHAAFGGPTCAGIDRVAELGYAGWIDEQMALPGLGTRYAWLLERGHLEPSEKDFVTGFDGAMWRHLIASPDVLRQRVAHALSEILVVDVDGILRVGHFKAAAGAAYQDMLAAHAFGNYRDLLEAVTLSHQMGSFLSLVGSRRSDGAGREPDENFARELLQLFTIGLVELAPDGTVRAGPDGRPVPTYGQDDVVGLARAFTGWDVGDAMRWGGHDHWSSPMRLRPERHEPGEKRFLGTVVPAGADGGTTLGIALDAAFAHPNVGPFVGRQLIQRLVTSNPSPSYVAWVATRFDDDGTGTRGNLGAVVRAILLDPEARTEPLLDALTFGKAREPLVRFVHRARAFGAASEDGAWALYDLSDPAHRLGQAPLRARSVFNFYRPDHVPPNTALADDGLVAPELQIAHETSLVGYANFMEGVVPHGHGGVVPDYSAEVALAHDAEALVAHLDLVLAAAPSGSAPTLRRFRPTARAPRAACARSLTASTRMRRRCAASPSSLPRPTIAPTPSAMAGLSCSGTSCPKA